uniref:BING4 C-terminal domain-containing protein n=1 Tax=Medicago truncatula TaxID=3880 RepID=I3T283_MEDTR|nr:unknown [Medicago truncatula]
MSSRASLGSGISLKWPLNGYSRGRQKIKLWDLRKFEAFQTLPGHANTLEFSQKGLPACGNGSYIQVLRDVSGAQNYSRYMTHSMVKGYQIGKLAFRPYEDVLGIGHSMGLSSILIPGAGEPNFDSWVANPFETPKQRREKEIRSLLDKLPPETIMLDPSKIGTVKYSKTEKPTAQEIEAEMEAAVEAVKGKKLKKKTKGRSKAGKIKPKKQDAIANAKRPYLEQKIQEEKNLAKKKQKTNEGGELPKSLQRFVHKKPSS